MYILLNLYRFLAKTVYIVFRGFCRKSTIQRDAILCATIPQPIHNRPRLWFHAASVGELETLWTVICSVADENVELIITVFSKSAIRQLSKLNAELTERKVKILFSGYSPAEGSWGKAISLTKPILFITTKYEAWPELWATLSISRIPLIVVGAMARRSFRVAKFILKIFSVPVPECHFLVCRDMDILPLKRLFPISNVSCCGEPRWDRVLERNSVGSSRVKELMQLNSTWNRPWGVMGSIWLDDILFWDTYFEKCPGTLWIVPHKVDSKNVLMIKNKLIESGLHPVSVTDANANIDLNCIIVDEMGYLSELYASADWAYVGGGFTNGVHSTIEPGINGIPIAIGPKNADKFSEISQLRESNQLTVLHTGDELDRWLTGLTSKLNSDVRKRYMQHISEYFGATRNVHEKIQSLLPRNSVQL